MPTLTITNRTRNRISLPSIPPFTHGDSYSPQVSLADILLDAGESRTFQVSISEVDAAEVALRSLRDRGVVYVAVTEDNASLLAQGVYSSGSVGPQGAAGADGVDGVQGDIGLQGGLGLQGNQGNVGPQGEIGPQGP